MRVSRKTALITGAGSGIGRALALEAASAGYHVILVGRREAPLLETSERIGAKGCHIIVADITVPEDRAKIAAVMVGGLDLLINNAGALSVGRFSDLSDMQAEMMVQTNILAPILLSRDLVSALRRRQGRIVNIGSMFGDIAFPFFAVYSATKFAMRGLSDALRRELRQDGISVTYVAPRATRTSVQDKFDALVDPFSMKLDTPEKVAANAWRGIMAGRSNVYPGAAEQVFVTLQNLVPRLIGRALVRRALAPKTQQALNFLPDNVRAEK